MGRLCELCLTRDAMREINQYGICLECENRYPLLIKGLEYELGGIPDRYREGEQTHWYTYTGVRRTQDIRRMDPPDSLNTYAANFRTITSQLGVKRALTYLLLHHFVGDIVLQDCGYANGEVGLPPRIIQYGLSLAASVPSVSYSNCISPVEKKGISQLCEVSSESSPHQQKHPEFEELQRLIANLEAIYALSANELNSFDPDTEEFKALNAAQALNLGEDGFAYPKQYLEAMERWYSPFQYVFLQQMELNIVKAVSWAHDLLELFHNRYVDVLQQIRWYQTDALRLIGDMVEPMFNDKVESFETDIPRVELQRTEQLSWATLVPLVENRLWISRKELVARVGPENPSKFLTFLDRISKSAGRFTATKPGGFIETEKHPLIRIGNRYLVPEKRHFARSLANTFFHDITNWRVNICFNDEKKGNREEDNSEKANFGNIRGDITEDWVSDCVLRQFNSEQTYLNVGHEESDREIDVLTIKGKTALVFEVKSKSLTKQALGGDLEKIYSDLENGIKGATKQLDNLIHQLEDGEFDDKIPELQQVSEYLPIVAVGTTYGSFGTTVYPALLEKEFVPYVVSTYDLDVITRILSASEIIEYVRDRSNQNKAGQLRSMDEMDYLGMFLDGPWIGSEGLLSEQFNNIDTQTGTTLVAPITGAHRFVDEQVPELTQLAHLPFLTPGERYNQR